ncbi:MAG: serine/threonine protein kinase, partial [Deltaproteobacteria bacterium]|nr:serine/threonine protein kinase [Deltaproteobacteria bacterium]
RRTGETVAGKYHVGALLGVGGMAAVYSARHSVLQREIALKILHKRYATDRELGARIVREARETAAMGHPAFVDVHDAGVTEDGCAYIEMESLDGRDLHSIRKSDGALDPQRVVTIAVAVLDALEAMHARGVVHRDIKSSNIYISPGADGRDKVKLLDLGFAKVEDELKLTAKNQLLGTPFYISPEQYVDPTSVDARSDLFSLGVVMFEVLTAKWPYSYVSKKELLSKVVKGDLERHPARQKPELPAWLDLIVARALAHSRDQRYASASEMKDALERAAFPDAPKPGLFRRLFGRTKPPPNA